MTTGRMGAYEIRRAEPSDVNEIALAHRDSIQSIGPSYYPEEIVGYWQEAIEGQLYLKAMDGGEVFFIAVGDVDGKRAVLGFASDYCIEGQRHGSSVYVRGRSARQGIGSGYPGGSDCALLGTAPRSPECEAASRLGSTRVGVRFGNPNQRDGQSADLRVTDPRGRS